MELQSFFRPLPRVLCLAACSLLALASCSSSDATADGKTVPSGGTNSGGTNSGGTNSGGTNSGGTNSGGSGGINATGGTGAGGSSGATGCEKIDFLFVVDNSVSMEGEQTLLAAAFPGFISSIEATVKAGSNYHVLVTDTDEWGRCNTANPWTGMDPTSNTCNSYIKNTVFQECDRVRGAGVVHPAGEFASNQDCGVPAGRRFLQEGDANVATTFACMAKVGTAGHPSERPMDGMVEAISSALNGPGGCNEGFLRDDAVLVITFISDDPNYEDSGDAQTWYDAVVKAKHDDPNAVVVVGFTPNFPNCQPNSQNIKGAHWAEFVAKFPYSLHADVCSADYASVFAQAIQLIDDSCDNYVPPPVR